MSHALQRGAGSLLAAAVPQHVPPVMTQRHVPQDVPPQVLCPPYQQLHECHTVLMSMPTQEGTLGAQVDFNLHARHKRTVHCRAVLTIKQEHPGHGIHLTIVLSHDHASTLMYVILSGLTAIRMFSTSPCQCQHDQIQEVGCFPVAATQAASPYLQKPSAPAEVQSLR